MGQEKIKIGFRVSIGSDGSYKNLSIELVDINRISVYSHTLLTISYQCNHDSNEWYAGRIKICQESLEGLNSAYKIAKGIFQYSDKEEICWENNPAEVLKYLEKKKYEQVFYDSRIHNFSPIKGMIPQEWKGFMIWDARGRGSNLKNIIAASFEDAKKQAIKYIAEQLANQYISDETKEFYVEWIKNPDLRPMPTESNVSEESIMLWQDKLNL